MKNHINSLLTLCSLLVAVGLARQPLFAGDTAMDAATRRPPRLGVDLNHFDALKKTMALPDGEVLAYVDWSDSVGALIAAPAGSAVASTASAATTGTTDVPTDVPPAARKGGPSGVPIVLIHGYTDSARDWVPMLPYFGKGRRLILVDIRGHGQSSKPECCYTRLDFAYDIKLLLDGLGIRKADIVGHSLGSIIAQTFAEYWPERTSHVVLISSTGGEPPGTPKKPADLDFAAQIRQLKEPIEPDSPFMIAWWDSPTPVDPDFIRRERRDAAGIPLRVWLAVLDQGLPEETAYGDLQRTLPRLKAPTLLIWGSKDPIMEQPVRDSLRRGLPQAQVKIFDGLGHNPFWENPRGVAQVINTFLAH